MFKIGLNEVQQVDSESLGIFQRESRIAIVNPSMRQGSGMHLKKCKDV